MTEKNKNKKEQTSKQRKAEPSKMAKKTRRDKVSNVRLEGQRSCRTDNETPAEKIAEKPQTSKIKHQKRDQKQKETGEENQKYGEESENDNKNRHKMKKLKSKRKG